ncbi:putative hemolysin [Cellvibrio japonicus Ueda107] [Mycolicibacterium parafortuitum]|uniref:Putative hemolysin [Cellvibrio japonicus Ueda107] n=1 Tax=Mycolicibacterium parafortuitum TaxID=39692 RepID=A0A375YKP8_MYCPF|nr:putative hemolysin [Cellvibrio japonicus Ueda107] [Mycolicibacterium parafortuitum]
MGLAAAIISGQGVASAGTDDGSASGDSSATPPGKRNAAADRPVARSGQSDSPSSSSEDGETDTETDTGADPIGTDTDVEDSDPDSELEPAEEIDAEEIDAEEMDEETASEADAAGSEATRAPRKPSAAERPTLSTGRGAPAQDGGTTATETDPPAPAPVGSSADSGSAPAPNAPGGSTGNPATAAPDPVPATPATEDEAEASFIINIVKELVKAFGGATTPGGDSAPPLSIEQVLQGIWLGRKDQQTANPTSELIELANEKTLAELSTSIGWIPFVGTGIYVVSLLGNLGALGSAILRGDSADVADELRDIGRDLIGLVPVVGAPTAGKLYGGGDSATVGASAQAATLAAATPPPPVGTQAHFLWVLQRAVNRLAGWPGVPKNFVDITNRVTDQTLDNSNNQLDVLIANAFAGSPAVWLPDLGRVLGLFVLSALPNYSYTDSLNAWGSFLNKIMPPFKIADGAGTLDVISNYKIMGAAVVGAATLLRDMLNGIYDPVQWEINIIKATTGATVTASDLNNFTALQNKIVAAQAGAILVGGDGGAFDDPTRAWNVTLPTWTAAQVNPYTITTYVALVALYKRFQEMATLTTFTTWTTYDSWHYTNGLGMYAAGTFHAVDPDGGSIEFRADGTLGRTYTTEGNALVTINTVQGGFTYTPPALWDPKAQGAAFRHRSTAEDPEERFDWVTVQAYSADGVPYNIRVGIEIINGTNAAPVYTGVTGQNTDALGVVKGKINGSDSDGDPLRFYLVDSSVNGLTGNSAYTKNGSGNGGIVTVNETTGDFTYVSSATAGANQSFQVRINDKHYGNTIVTITVPNTTSITPGNVNTSTPYVVTGTPPASTNKPGAFTSYTLVGGTTKGTVTSFNPATGAFTYTSSVGRVLNNDDVITMIATDADGRSVTLRLNVKPSTVTTNPTLTLTTPPTVGTLNGTTQTSTGKLTYYDADGDAPVWPASVTSAKGGTVTIAADGTFTYTSNFTVAQRHAVARIGATSTVPATGVALPTYNGVALNAWDDAFTMTVSDGFGGTAQLTVKVPIYAINANPQLGLGSLVCAFTSCTITITTTDPDGDNLSGSLSTSNNGTGAPWYTLERGSVTVNAGNQHTMSWGGNNNGAGTQQTGNQRYTVYDGYYRVTNGVVDSSYFSRAWVNWSNTTRTTGN